MNDFDPESQTAGLCDRCLKELIHGRGEFYEVNIDARVDSSPPILDAPAMGLDEIEEEWGKVIEQMESIPQVDAMNQVYCKRRILLCSPCFQIWIENPSGSE